MSLNEVLLWLLGAGAAGGVVAGLIDPNGLAWPGFIRVKTGDTEKKFLNTGFIGPIIVGAVAAAINWFVYGPFADETVIGGEQAAAAAEGGAAAASQGTEYSITFLMVGTSLLIGLVGGKWLSAEAEKKLFKAAAVEAATKNPNAGDAARIAGSNGAEALEIAAAM